MLEGSKVKNLYIKEIAEVIQKKRSQVIFYNCECLNCGGVFKVGEEGLKSRAKGAKHCRFCCGGNRSYYANYMKRQNSENI